MVGLSEQRLIRTPSVKLAELGRYLAELGLDLAALRVVRPERIARALCLASADQVNSSRPIFQPPLKWRTERSTVPQKKFIDGLRVVTGELYFMRLLPVSAVPGSPRVTHYFLAIVGVLR